MSYYFTVTGGCGGKGGGRRGVENVEGFGGKGEGREGVEEKVVRWSKGTRRVWRQGTRRVWRE